MPFVEHRQRLYPLREGRNIVGGGADCDVRLPDVEAGAVLAIVVSGQGTKVEGGRGTALNGRALSNGPELLTHEDRLSVGDATLLFLDEASPSAAVGASSETSAGASATEGAEEPARTVAVLTRLDDGQVHVLDRTGVKIGREKTCDIVIPDRSVSRLHAEVVVEKGRYALRDLSRNGTRVNGERAKEVHPLAIGDVIRVGNYEFAFSRRPVGLVAGAAQDVTPVRATVPDAPTMEVSRKELEAESSGGVGFVVLRWALILAVAGVIAAALLGS